MSTAVKNPMKIPEFVALMAMLFATIAFSVDAMLPSLPQIGAELSPGDPNRAQLIVTSFILGMGLGTFVTGPLSDTYGRHRVIFGGAALYILGAAIAWQSTTIEVTLAARVLQGLGAAGPRVVSVAIMRDLYSGRQMARLMSIAMTIFTLVPAIAPLLGAAITASVGWRGIFVAFILFSLISMIWLKLRLPETLPHAERRPFRAAMIWAALIELFANSAVRLSILVQMFCFSILFSLLVTVQPIYDIVFDRADSFPWWFGAIALVAGTAGFLNAALVGSIGMRKLVTVALAVEIAITATVLIVTQFDLADPAAFYVFVAWQTSLFFMAGMTIGNLNAIAMEPMGHIAGLAASVIGGVATVVASAIASTVGLFFDGTILPLTVAVLAMLVIAYLLMVHMGRVEARLAT